MPKNEHYMNNYNYIQIFDCINTNYIYFIKSSVLFLNLQTEKYKTKVGFFYL